MIPDRLPEALREIIARFPRGSIQFEVGIQTFNPEVSERIKRRQNYLKLKENFEYLRRQTGAHIHADLIVGLPGETIESFGAGFNQLVALGPQEIQVGILKRLRGTPIIRHDSEWAMLYNPVPPYEILRNKSVSFDEMQRMKRFARHWDLMANSGNFLHSLPLLWRPGNAPFDAFMRWSQWLYEKMGRNYGIALGTLVELFFTYLVVEQGISEPEAANTIYKDYQALGRSDKPPLLRPYLTQEEFPKGSSKARASNALPKRQARHVASTHENGSFGA